MSLFFIIYLFIILYILLIIIDKLIERLNINGTISKYLIMLKKSTFISKKMY